MPENTVYVGRGSKWGNPFKVDEVTRIAKYPAYVSMPILSGEVIPRDRREAVRLYEYIFMGLFDFPGLHLSLDDVCNQLVGKDLACWCPIDEPCHADFLLKIANGKRP